MEQSLFNGFILDPENDARVCDDRDQIRLYFAVAAFVDRAFRERAFRCPGGIPKTEVRVIRLDLLKITEEIKFNSQIGQVSFPDGSTLFVSSAWEPGMTKGIFNVQNRSVEVGILLSNGSPSISTNLGYTIVISRSVHTAKLAMIVPPRASLVRSPVLHSPMPGVIIRLFAGPGDTVKNGDAVAIIEAMKMENKISAPTSMQVDTVFVREGATVSTGQPILKWTNLESEDH